MIPLINRVLKFFPRQAATEGKALVRQSVARSVPPETDISDVVASMRDDPQAAITMRMITAALRNASMRVVSPDDDSDEATFHARHLTDLWNSHQRYVWEALEYGRAAFELVWKNDPVSKATVIHRMDYAEAKLNGYPFSFYEVAPDGGFGGIRCEPEGEKPFIVLPSQAWWFGLYATPMRPHGDSLYLGAPMKVRQFRKDLLADLSRFIKRHLVSSGVAYLQPTVVDQSTGEIVDNFEVVLGALSQVESGGWVGLPSNRDAQGHLLNEVKEWQDARSPQPLIDLLQMTDAWMSRAFGVHEKLTMEGNAAGSFAALAQMTYLLLSSAEEILSQARESFWKHVVKKQETRNTPEGYGLRVVYTPLSQGPESLLVQLAKGWLTNNTISPLLQSGAIDLIAVLESTGVPIEAGARASIKEMLSKAQEAANQPPPPMPGMPAVGGASGSRQPPGRPAEQGGDGGKHDNKSPDPSPAQPRATPPHDSGAQSQPFKAKP